MTTANDTLVTLAFYDSELEEKLATMVDEREGFAVSPPNGDLAGTLLLMELGPEPEKDLSRLSHIIQSGAAADVIVIGPGLDPEILLAAMRAGAKEFLPTPVNGQDFLDALDRCRVRLGRREMVKAGKSGRLITVLGAKGGIGATTVAVNLAHVLNQSRPGSVALLDFRQPLGEVPFFLDMEYTYTWHEATANLDRLDSTYLMSVLAKHPSGLYVLPAPGVMDEEADMPPLAAQRMIELLLSMFDYVVIDGNLSLDETSAKVMELSDELFMVMVLSLPCLANVKKVIETLKGYNPALEDKMHLVVNRHLSSSEINISEAESVVGKKMEWLIPNDYAASLSSINQGKPLVASAPKTPVAKAFARMGRSMATKEDSRRKNSSSLLGKIFRKGAPVAA